MSLPKPEIDLVRLKAKYRDPKGRVIIPLPRDEPDESKIYELCIPYSGYRWTKNKSSGGWEMREKDDGYSCFLVSRIGVWDEDDERFDWGREVYNEIDWEYYDDDLHFREYYILHDDVNEEGEYIPPSILADYKIERKTWNVQRTKEKLYGDLED